MCVCVKYRSMRVLQYVYRCRCVCDIWRWCVLFLNIRSAQEKEIFLIHIGLGFSTCAGFQLTTEDDEFHSPTMISLCQKSAAFGTKDFVDQIVDSRKFTAAISDHLTDFATRHEGAKFNHNRDFVYKSFETYMSVWAARIEKQVCFVLLV